MRMLLLRKFEDQIDDRCGVVRYKKMRSSEMEDNTGCDGPLQINIDFVTGISFPFLPG